MKTAIKRRTSKVARSKPKLSQSKLRFLKLNAKKIVDESLEKARKKTRPIQLYVHKKPMKTLGATFLMGLCGGAAIGYFYDKFR